MAEKSVLAIMAPARERDNRWTRSTAGLIGIGFLTLVVVLCLGTLWWTLGTSSGASVPRYVAGDAKAAFVPPFGMNPGPDEARNVNSLVDAEVVKEIADRHGVSPGEALRQVDGPIAEELRKHWPTKGLGYALGTDALGRSLLVRVLAGGGISLTIGIAAALLSVFIGTVYGALSGYIGGKTDAVMMRIVDILYGLPYVLLVVLLAVAVDAMIEEKQARTKERVSWVKSNLRELAKIDLGEDVTREEIDTWKLDPPSERVMPALVNLAVESFERRWSHDLKEAAKERDRRDRAIARARTPEERTAAEALAVTEVPPEAPDRAAAEAAVAGCASVDAAVTLCGDVSIWTAPLTSGKRKALEMVTLLVAIGAVSWLTLARVVRGQVLSLKGQPFIEAARAMGASGQRIFLKHLLPNLMGPIIVYATLTVPQAILQESFLSFLGIGVKPPMPSWGNLAADGLMELNVHRSNWWLLAFPCVLLGATLLALNFVGEGLREAFDPRRARAK